MSKLMSKRLEPTAEELIKFPVKREDWHIDGTGAFTMPGKNARTMTNLEYEIWRAMCECQRRIAIADGTWSVVDHPNVI